MLTRSSYSPCRAWYKHTAAGHVLIVVAARAGGSLRSPCSVPFCETHLRVRFDDIRRYKDETDAARRRTLDELAAEAQELRMGYQAGGCHVSRRISALPRPAPLRDILLELAVSDIYRDPRQALANARARPKEGVGGARLRAKCTGRMDWPRRGVYFFIEPNQVRTDSGTGPRVVRVGTHALTSRRKKDGASDRWVTRSDGTQFLIEDIGSRS